MSQARGSINYAKERAERRSLVERGIMRNAAHQRLIDAGLAQMMTCWPMCAFNRYVYVCARDAQSFAPRRLESALIDYNFAVNEGIVFA